MQRADYQGKKVPLSVIILTYNEEANIEQCLRSLHSWVEEIFIIDSFSTDATLEICKRYTTHIYQHEFKTQADQFNWALDNLPISSEWILRLDADEYLTDGLKEEIARVIPILPLEVTALCVKRRVYFMGRWIRFGGYYPTWLLRLFRKGSARCEERLMDEHMMLLRGKVGRLNCDIVEHNRKEISEWVEKYNRYASREASELSKGVIGSRHQALADRHIKRKRWLKQNVYARAPLFLRAILYFTYRYFLRLGFLDGVEGFVFHFFQGLWYRFLVDIKIYESKKAKKVDHPGPA
jgi:glycosyltransferase involved in cell wall biosynthesis